MLKYKEWNLNQVIAGCIVTFGGFGFGCNLSWTATALPSLDLTGQVGTLTNVEKSWIASFMAIGALVACPVAGLFLRNVGRKVALIGLSIVAFKGWLLLALGSHPVHLYFGRFLLGASCGGYTVSIPIYVSEIASKQRRGLIGSMFLIMLCLGKLYSNLVGIYFTASTASLLCSLHSLLYITHLMLIPESPKVLMLQNKVTEAYYSLSWFEAKGVSSLLPCSRHRHWEASNANSKEIWTKLEQFKNTANKPLDLKADPIITSPEKFCRGEIVKPLVTVFLQMTFAQLCGINVSTFYTVEIFRMSGDGLINSELATVLLALIQTVGCLPCSIFVDKYGRKFLLVSSFFFMAISTAIFAAFFFINDTLQVKLLEKYPYLGTIPLICLVIYNLAYAWGVGSVVWITVSEILPPSIVGPASAVANIIFWGSAILMLQSFQLFKNEIPLYLWFAGFSVVCTFGFIFNQLYLPETKGLSLEEIQAFYKSKTPLNQQESTESGKTYLSYTIVTHL